MAEAERRFVQLKRIRMYVEERGRGNPVVFLHGYPFDHTIWNDLVPYLRPDARAFFPDLRGFGKTDAPAETYTMAQHAQDVAGLLDSLGLEAAALVGHSLGGYIGFAFAQLYPSRLTGLGLVATQAVADTPEQRDGRYATAEKALTQGAVVAADMMPPIVSSDPNLQRRLRELILEARPEGIAGTLRGMAERPDSLPFLPEIRVPVEIVAGGEDRGIRLDRSREMERLIPSSHLTVVPGAGHMVMIESPAATAEAINRLLSRTM